MASKLLNNLAKPEFEGIEVKFYRDAFENVCVQFDSDMCHCRQIFDEEDLNLNVSTMDKWLTTMLLAFKLRHDSIAEAKNE